MHSKCVGECGLVVPLWDDDTKELLKHTYISIQVASVTVYAAAIAAY